MPTAKLRAHSFLSAVRTAQKLECGPHHAGQRPAPRLLTIFWLSPACHPALAHEAQPGICADTYLVGATLLLSCSNAGSSGYMQQQDRRHYVERAEAEGLLMRSYYWPKVRKHHRCQ